jgi:hypothetical protein
MSQWFCAGPHNITSFREAGVGFFLDLADLPNTKLPTQSVSCPTLFFVPMAPNSSSMPPIDG